MRSHSALYDESFGLFRRQFENIGRQQFIGYDNPSAVVAVNTSAANQIFQQAMTEVRAQVNEETNKGQLPWGHTNLIGSVYLNPVAGATDAAGLPVAINQTLSRANMLVKLLESSTAAERLRAYGLGYAGASVIRDLSDKVDGNYEDRAQVDLTIYASDPVLLVATAFASAELDIKFQTSIGLVTTHAEVTP